MIHPEADDSVKEILGDRYQIQQKIGERAGRSTFIALDRQTQAKVVVKTLLFGNGSQWQDFKLFEREAQILQAISHTNIPSYLDYFALKSPDNQGFALVQSYIDAQSLEEQITNGRSFSEAEVQEIARAILEILIFLHGRKPPIIHRDIKPSNILLGDRSGNSVGKVYLVDFGAVQSLATQNNTITVVGTYGYMPPEQFGGRSTPASDLYSLGATLIYLVTGKHPADLPETDLRIEFEQFANISVELSDWLKWMTQPSLSKRLVSAQQALTALEQNSITTVKLSTQISTKNTNLECNQPNTSKVLLKKSDRSIEILIPPVGFLSDTTYANLFALIWACGRVVIIWILFLTFIKLILAVTGDGNLVKLLGLLQYGSILFYLDRVFRPLLLIGLAAFGQKRLYLDRRQISWTSKLFGIERYHLPATARGDIFRLELVCLSNSPYLRIWTAKHNYEIANDPYFPLTPQEIKWLAYELGNWLNLEVEETY